MFKEMQTDPNWSNFLWNERTKQVRICSLPSFLYPHHPEFPRFYFYPDHVIDYIYSMHSIIKIELVDFGATRSYTDVFMDDWLRLLKAAAEEDIEGCREWSLKLGYLTGEESEVRFPHLFFFSPPTTPSRFCFSYEDNI